MVLVGQAGNGVIDLVIDLVIVFAADQLTVSGDRFMTIYVLEPWIAFEPGGVPMSSLSV